MKAPVIGVASCTVPGCERAVSLGGTRQGFQVAAAKSHGMAHWYRHHEESGHEAPSVPQCPKCKEDGWTCSFMKRKYYSGR